jgi:hypothetical protein
MEGNAFCLVTAYFRPYAFSICNLVPLVFSETLPRQMGFLGWDLMYKVKHSCCDA